MSYSFILNLFIYIIHRHVKMIVKFLFGLYKFKKKKFIKKMLSEYDLEILDIG